MADEKTPEKAAPKAPVVKAPELVTLYLESPHTRFDLSGVGLEDLVPEGTAYSPADADTVRMLCRKYRIRIREGQ
jgi:hypothetical protein